MIMSASELSSLTLFPATPAQVVESRRRTFKEWGRTMTEEEYRRRDETMDHHEHAADGKLITWSVRLIWHQYMHSDNIYLRVLCPVDESATLDFRCSCET